MIRDRPLLHNVILPYLFLNIFVLLLLAQITPWWNPPEAFDAYSYLEMSKDPIAARYSIASHHYERILPSVFIYVLHTVTGVPHVALFRIVSNVSFLFLANLTYWLIRTWSGASWLGVPVTITMFVFSWPVTYNVANFYQLCDLWTFIFAILLSIAIVKRKFYVFFLVSTLAILTRQNLIVLVFFGYLYFIRFKTLFDRKNLWTAGVGVLHGFLVVWVVWFLSPSTSTSLQYFDLQGLKELPLSVLLVIPQTLAPFVLTILLNARVMIRLSLRYFPVLAFVIVTILQPLTVLNITGYENAQRLMMPALWLPQMAAAVLLIRAAKDAPRLWPRVVLFLSPFLVGTSHLVGTSSVLIRPLLVLPSRVRYVVDFVYASVTAVQRRSA